MTKPRNPHPLDNLPFTALRDGKELPKYTEGQLPRCFWNVKPTGSYASDSRLGTEYALLYLAYEEKDPDSPGFLAHIVNDMPREQSGIEVGFLGLVCYAASAGADRARQIAAYWTTCMREES